MLIGQAAKKSGVSVETIRYYERQHILARPNASSGFRDYSEEVVETIQFVKNAQTLGFALREIKDLLAIKVDPDSDCGMIKNRALQKIEEIDNKIEALQQMRESLVSITEKCSGKGPVSGCTILNALDRKE